MRKSLRYLVVTAAAMGAALAAFHWQREARAAAADTPALRIEVSAKKFAFGPADIRVKKGSRVTVVLISPDFVHGFSVPDFNVRADGIPGKAIEVTFVADRPGKFIYLCDNFCGEDHDKMRGWLIVTES